MVALALLLVGCSSAGGKKAATTRSGATATSAPAQQRGPFAVGRRSIVLVDHTRPTTADPQRNLPTKPDRTLPVMLLYPAAGPVSPTGAPTDDAPPAAGRFPLVVFSHGITGSGPIYTAMLQVWSRAGYVIAAPTFPLSGPGAIFPGDNVDLSDYENQPADVSFVLTTLLAKGGPGGIVSDHIDAAKIAAAGHSLGAITTFGIAYNTCCIDRRIKAVVALSGIELPFSKGTFDNPPPTPLLLVHGTDDHTVPIAAGSDRIFSLAAPPVYEMRELGASHTDVPFSPKYAPLTDQAAIAFLDAYLKGDTPELHAMPDVVAKSGIATWQDRLP